MPTSRLSLPAPARVHGEISRENEGQGALKPILEESARRNKKTLEILKCRDFDTEADTVKKMFLTHGLGFVIPYFIYIYIYMSCPGFPDLLFYQLPLIVYTSFYCFFSESGTRFLVSYFSMCFLFFLLFFCEERGETGYQLIDTNDPYAQ